jgi:hypothetical protein
LSSDTATKDASKEKTSDETTPKSRVPLSPRYPFVSLPKAIERAQEFYDEDGQNPAARSVVFKHWGYTPKSSGAQQTAAALKAYGLLEGAGKGKLKLTNRALRILVDKREDSPDRLRAIRDAALSPTLFRNASEAWGTDTARMPSKANILTELQLNWGFKNEEVAHDFLKKYTETVHTAKLGSAELSKEEEEEEVAITVGDTVQWESQGVDQFAEPRRVREVQEHEGELWVLVEGEAAGIPASQVRVVGKSQVVKTPPVHFASPILLPPVLLPRGAATGGPDSLSLTVPFRGKTLVVLVRSEGEPLRRDHVEKAIKHLNLAKEDLDPEDSGNPRQLPEDEAESGT